MQSKAQLIDSILQLAPTTGHAWLQSFDVSALKRYFDHLQHALEPRGAESYWIRDGETAAVFTRSPAA